MQNKFFKNSTNSFNDFWSPLAAKEILTAWQREFTALIYNHKLNFHNDETEKRIVHPLASTSISDMLAEFCDFNYLIIFVGYFVMVIFYIQFLFIFFIYF